MILLEKSIVPITDYASSRLLYIVFCLYCLKQFRFLQEYLKLNKMVHLRFFIYYVGYRCEHSKYMRIPEK